jgi:small subunit ribosomal protein S17
MVECTDIKCPEHGELATRGMTFQGKVISDKMQGTAIVFIEYTVKVPKFERYKRRHSRIKVHNPPCINAKVGDLVKIAECRPLSKTVHFVIIEKLRNADDEAKIHLSKDVIEAGKKAKASEEKTATAAKTHETKQNK